MLPVSLLTWCCLLLHWPLCSLWGPSWPQMLQLLPHSVLIMLPPPCSQWCVLLKRVSSSFCFLSCQVRNPSKYLYVYLFPSLLRLCCVKAWTHLGWTPHGLSHFSSIPRRDASTWQERAWKGWEEGPGVMAGEGIYLAYFPCCSKRRAQGPQLLVLLGGVSLLYRLSCRHPHVLVYCKCNY